DSGGAADLQGLGRGPTQDRGQQGRGGPQPGCQVLVAAGAVHAIGIVVAGMVVAVLVAVLVAAAGVAVAVVVVAGGVLVVVVAGGLAGDQDPGDRAVTGQPLAGLRWQRPQLGVAAQRAPVAD